MPLTGSQAKSAEAFQCAVCMRVDPGVCGFPCRIRARKSDRRTVAVFIEESACKQVQRFSEKIGKLTLRDLFAPITQNPVYLAAQQSGCHASCVIPAAVLKTAEAAMEMAVPRDVRMAFAVCED